MADESLQVSAADEASPVDPSVQQSSSVTRLNASAPEFVPSSSPSPPLHRHQQHRRRRHPPPPPPPPPVAHRPPMMKFHHYHPHHHYPHGPLPPPVIHVFHPPPPPPPQFFAPVPDHAPFEYFGGGAVVYGEHEAMSGGKKDGDVASPPATDGLSEEVVRKIKKQVEYYFSDINLATTEHLMRFISKDAEGFVPISVIASFNKIKALVQDNSLLATALRTSSKLVVSDDGQRVRRDKPFSESDVTALQSRIVVAENLPDDHCYQNLMKVFSPAGSVKMIRTCYPQSVNGSTGAVNKSSKLEMLFSNKLHAFVEYETIEDAEKAVVELNDEKNWRNGLRVRLLYKCLIRQEQGQGKRIGHEDNEIGEDVSASNQSNKKEVNERSPESVLHMGEGGFNDNGEARHGKGRGRGARGRVHARGQYHNHRTHNEHHDINISTSTHQMNGQEHPVASKPILGPRMPDGTRGFAMGRGKSLILASNSS